MTSVIRWLGDVRIETLFFNLMKEISYLDELFKKGLISLKKGHSGVLKLSLCASFGEGPHHKSVLYGVFTLHFCQRLFLGDPTFDLFL